MINASSRRWLARFALPFVVAWAVVAPRESYAVLPALAFVDFGVGLVETLVIRSVARQTVTTITVAANDANWSATVASWLSAGRAVGSVAMSVNNLQGEHQPITVVEAQIEGTAAGDLTAAAQVTGYGIAYGCADCGANIEAYQSMDGVRHYVPDLRGLTQESVGAMWVNWWNQFAKPEWQMTLRDCVAYNDGFSDVYYCKAECAMPGYDDASVGDFYVAPMNHAVNVEGADGIGRLIGTAGDWTADPSDPDWTVAQREQYLHMAGIRLSGVSATATPAVIDIAEGVSTGVRVRYQEQVTSTKIRELVINADGAQVPAEYVETVADGSIATYPTSSSNTATTGSTVVFPTDYARQGEAGLAAQALGVKVDRIGDAFNTTSLVDDPAAPLVADMPWFGETFSALSGWTLPGHVSTCPTPSLDLSMVLGSGQVYVMDDHCALFQDNQAPMRAAAIVGWLILALFVFLRA